ncbi:MAG: phage holin family protein [Burkholderiales bacterium]
MKPRMQPEAPASAGLFESLRRLVTTAINIAHTRLELISIELREEKVRLLSLLVRTLAALALLGLGVILATLFIVVLFWDTHRLLALGIMTLIFLAGGVALGLRVVQDLKAAPKLFAESITELVKDRESLSIPNAERIQD